VRFFAAAMRFFLVPALFCGRCGIFPLPFLMKTVLAWSLQKSEGYMLWTPEMNGESMEDRAEMMDVTHLDATP
jgi:hypothetical protein